jgi:hypothetical protein
LFRSLAASVATPILYYHEYFQAFISCSPFDSTSDHHIYCLTARLSGGA